MIQESINRLGRRAKDKVTGFEGVVDSVCFDLYGCIQLSVKPTTPDKDGKVREGYWFDVHRVEILEAAPVMPVPQFDARGKDPSTFDHGPAEKPTSRG